MSKEISQEKLIKEVKKRIEIIRKIPDGFGRETLYIGTSRLAGLNIKNPDISDNLLIELEDAYLRRKLKKVI